MTDQASNIRQLLDIMARLRDPEHGCPWDVEQTFATIAPYTIEDTGDIPAMGEQGGHAYNGQVPVITGLT